MSPYHRMRDPIENQDLLPIFTFWGERPELEASVFATMADLKAARDASRVLAFSRDAGDGKELHHAPFDCSWARPRMWEQYGDNHSAVSLLFDRAGQLARQHRQPLSDESSRERRRHGVSA